MCDPPDWRLGEGLEPPHPKGDSFLRSAIQGLGTGRKDLEVTSTDSGFIHSRLPVCQYLQGYYDTIL